MNFRERERTGQTKRMVESLPDEKCVVIVHSQVMRRYLDRMIADLRGARQREITQIEVVTCPSDAYSFLRGYEVPVFVDHALPLLVSRETLYVINHLTGHLQVSA